MRALSISHVEHRVPGSGVWRPGATSHEEAGTDLQDYLRPLEQVHAGTLHGVGVAAGLDVTAAAGATAVTVAPGVAVDPAGRHVALTPGTAAETADEPDKVSAPVTVDDTGVTLPTTGRSGTCLVTLQWRETFDKALLESSFQQTFLDRHTPWLRIVAAGDEAAEDRLVLATLTLGDDGTVAADGLSAEGRVGLTLRGGGLTLTPTAVRGTAVGEAPAASLGPRADGGLEIRIPGAAAPPLTVSGAGDVGVAEKLSVAGALGVAGELGVGGLAALAGGARLGGVTAGTRGAGVDYAPYEYESVGVGDPLFNLRLQSPQSIFFHTGDPVTPHASLDGAGNLGLRGGLTLQGGVALQAGAAITSTGRLHVSGEELLYLLNKSGVIVGREWGGNGNLTVQGTLRADSGLTMGGGGTIGSTGRMHVTGEELLYLLNKSGVIIGREWGGNGNLNVQGALYVNGDVRLGADDGTVYIGGNQTGRFIAFHDDLWFADPQNGTIELRNALNQPGTLVGQFKGPSSITLKQDVAALDARAHRDLLDDVLRTELVTFRYRDAPSDSRPQLGVIAEHCADSIAPAGEKSINPMEWAAVLHGAIKVLAERLEALEARR